MKLKKILCIAIIFVLLISVSSSVWATNTTGKTGIFTLNIPSGYTKILDDYRDYFEMETYDAEGTDTFFRVVVYDKKFFDLNLSGTMWFSYLLNIPKGNLNGFTQGDLDKDSKTIEIENQGYKVTNKKLLSVNGYPARRVTAVVDSGYTTDVYQIVSNKYFAELYFYGETAESSKKFIGSDMQKNILNSFKFNNDSASKCLNLGFKDTYSTDWYLNAVKYVYENNIIKGTSSTTFSPNDKLTRGMMVTILYRMEGEPKVTGTPKFTDVKDSSKYYYKAVKWATDKGIVSGYDNGKFGPNDNIQRQQLAVILNKYAKYKGKKVTQTNDLKEFSDSNQISNYAITQMKWAVGAGVVSGNVDKSTGKKALNPKGNATRAEAAAMLEKYCKNMGR